MSIFSSFLKKFFGDKSTKDIKKLLPILEQIKQEYAALQNISNDELRKRTQDLRDTIAKAIEPVNAKLEGYKAELASPEPLDIRRQEELYDEIDDCEKEIDNIIKAQLDEMLPKAFAIIKDTARRFKENETV